MVCFWASISVFQKLTPLLRLPFYSWIRLAVLSYLVLPQTQGAKLLYQEHISPFISKHESEIETFIANAHERAAALGLKYFKQAIELFRQRVLGLPPSASELETTTPSQPASYAQSLLSRFSIPAARPPATSDIYGMLSSAVAAATGGASAGKTSEAQIDQLSDSGMLYPKDVNSASDKLSFLDSQRENLRAMLSVVDKAAQKERGGGSDIGGDGTSVTDKDIVADVERRMGELGRKGLKKNQSEQSFDAIDPDEAKNGNGKESEKEHEKLKERRTTSGGWGGWFGGRGPSEETGAGKEANDGEKATSTGFEKSAEN